MFNNAKANILDTIGQTPIVKLNKVTAQVKSDIYVKLEYLNPGGSIKDRIGKFILEKAIETGQLRPGGTIIEGTSGNTGVGLAMFAAVHGYKCIFVLADKQSQEKIDNLRAFGAKVIVCPTNVAPEDPRSYYSVSKNLASTIPNSYYVDQYYNEFNAQTHYHETGPEIYKQTGGEIDSLIAGVGTGGSISGIGKYLKEKRPEIKIVGVDIEGSILAHYHQTKEICEAKPYVLEGIGEDIIPSNVHFDTIDDFVTVQDKESFIMTRRLLKEEGIYCGGSGGAAIVGAIRYAQQLAAPEKILVILPDSGNRYSSKIFNDDWMRDNGYVDSTFNVSIREVLKSLGKGVQRFHSIQDTITVGEAIAVFEEHGISQVPVYTKNDLTGILSEEKLLRPLFEGKISTNDRVSVVKQSNYLVIDEHELLQNAANALMAKKIVLITRKNEIVDILTHTDLLNFVSTQGRS